MAEEMLGPLVAVAGGTCLRGADGKPRNDPEAIQYKAQVADACKALGRALALKRCRLLVYSAEDDYIEPHVVSGYCEDLDLGATKSILYRHPKSYRSKFTEQSDTTKSHLFDEFTDLDAGWEASFYRSLAQADCVLLVAGGSSTTISGHVALALQRPLAPVGCFEGGASRLLTYVEQAPTPPTPDELQAMIDWTSTSANRITESLLRRHSIRSLQKAALDKELQDLRKENADWKKNVAEGSKTEAAEKQGTIVVIASAASAIVFGFISSLPHLVPILYVVAFLATLASAGSGGAGVQLLRTPVPNKTRKTLTLGAVAGALFGFLYLLPQLAGGQQAAVVPTNFVQFALTMLVAFGSGMAADSVLESYRSKSADRASGLVDGGLTSPTNKAG